MSKFLMLLEVKQEIVNNDHIERKLPFCVNIDHIITISRYYGESRCVIWIDGENGARIIAADFDNLAYELTHL